MTKQSVLMIIFILGISISSAFAQDKSNFVTEYESWKQTALAESQETPKSLLFLMAEVKRDDKQTATIKLGIGGFGKAFQITIKPLKIEKTSDGKFNQIELPEAATVRVRGLTTEEKFSDPPLKIFADPQANAIEISIKSERQKEESRLVLALSDQAAKGKITSVK